MQISPEYVGHTEAKLTELTGEQHAFLQAVPVELPAARRSSEDRQDDGGLRQPLLRLQPQRLPVHRCSPSHPVSAALLASGYANSGSSPPDTCYILSFAVIMLNTSLHNPNVKEKTSLQCFISMNRGINNGANLAAELLTVSRRATSLLHCC